MANLISRMGRAFLILGLSSVMAACAAPDGDLPSAQFVTADEGPGPQYIIGPLDTLDIFVWRNPELSANVIVRPDGRISVPLIDDLAATGRTPTQLSRDIEAQLATYIQNPIVTVIVRPDGRISVPLIDDLAATGRTPTQLSRDIEAQLATYIQNPIVTVIVSGFQGPFAQQVRVVGAAANPQAIPYRANMTLLDVMISVGGLTEFAAGNRASLVRFQDGRQREYRVRISSLLQDGDISANVTIMPGDVLIIPESIF